MSTGIQNKFAKVGLSPLGAFGILLLILLPLTPPFNKEYLIRWFTVALLMGAQAMTFDFTAGYISIINFGYCAFYGVGAYTSVIVGDKLGISPWLSMFIGIIPAALLGFLTGVLTLQLRGIFAAVMAWFVGLALMGVATKWIAVTKGPLGLRTGTLFNTSSNLPYYYTILVMMLIIYFVLSKIVGSRIGLAFLAIGQNMEAARSSGLNPTYYRIMNFTISCGFAGWLGGFHAHYFGVLVPEIMSTSKTIEVMVIAYLGGRGSLWGSMLATVPYAYLMGNIRTIFSNLPGLDHIVYGLFLILIMLFYPGGVAQICNSLIKASRKAKVDSPAAGESGEVVSRQN